MLAVDAAGWRVLAETDGSFAVLASRSGLRTRLAAGAPDLAQPAWQVVSGVETGGLALAPPFAVLSSVDPLGERECRVNDLADLPLALGRLERANGGAPVVVEEWLTGPSYYVTGWVSSSSVHVAAICELGRAEAPYRYITEIACPARVDDSLRDSLESIARSTVVTLGYQQGVFRIEICVTAEGPRVLSVAAGIGDIIRPYDVLLACGIVDLTETAIDLAMGRVPKAAQAPLRAVACRWIHARSGIVSAISGVEAASGMPGVEFVEMIAKPGDLLTHLINAETRGRLGVLAASARTTAEALSRAREGADTCRIETRTIL